MYSRSANETVLSSAKALRAHTGIITVNQNFILWGANKIPYFLSAFWSNICWPQVCLSAQSQGAGGIPVGVESVQIWPATNSSVFDMYNNAMSSVQTTGIKYLNDKSSPKILTGIPAADNTYIDLVLTKGIYAYAMAPVSEEMFTLTFVRNDGDAAGVAISDAVNVNGGNLTGGETVVRLLLDIAGLPSGEKYLVVKPVNGYSIFDTAGNAMASDQTTGPKYLNDQTAPAILSAFISEENSYVDISLTKGVYGLNMEMLEASALKIIFSRNGGMAQDVVISGISKTDGTALTGGKNRLRYGFLSRELRREWKQ